VIELVNRKENRQKQQGDCDIKRKDMQKSKQIHNPKTNNTEDADNKINHFTHL
jgi:hypothetical protein